MTKMDLMHIISSMSQKLDIPLNKVKYYLDGNLGTEWILRKNLNCSEVELGMSLKTIRKLLSYEFKYCFKLSNNIRINSELLRKIKLKYQQFFKLHSEYFYKNKSFPKILNILDIQNISIDSGINKERFIKLLPIILLKISPEELELCFTTNTLFRWYIAQKLQRAIKTKLYVRGSLLFFNSRPFGCGYTANFPQETNYFNRKSTYLSLQGSDLDIKIKQNNSLVKTKQKLHNLITNLKQHFFYLNSFLTIEISKIDNNSSDDILAIDMFPLILELLSELNLNKALEQNIKIKAGGQKKPLSKNVTNFLKFQLLQLGGKPPNNFPNMKLNNLGALQVDLYNFLSKQHLKPGNIKEIICLTAITLGYLKNKNFIRLTKNNITKLSLALKKTFHYYKVNDDLKSHFLFKWVHLLTKAKRETDFYGFITKKQLFLVFNNLFFLSGCRPSPKEKKALFNNLIKNYEA